MEGQLNTDKTMSVDVCINDIYLVPPELLCCKTSHAFVTVFTEKQVNTMGLFFRSHDVVAVIYFNKVKKKKKKREKNLNQILISAILLFITIF